MLMFILLYYSISIFYYIIIASMISWLFLSGLQPTIIVQINPVLHPGYLQ